LEDIGNEVEIRCQKIRQEADVLSMSLKNAFHVEMVRIPKNIRSMSLKEFCETYGEDIATLLKISMESSFESQTAVKPNSRMLATPAHHVRSVAQTPGFFPQTPACPPTALRAPRPGELMLSANGSPLGQMGEPGTTVKLRPNSATGVATITVDLQLGDGRTVALDPTAENAAANLDGDIKKEALSKLKNLQDEIHSLLSQLEG
ncbi:unnamed protein product, partial [Heterosigma akashiwo]